MRLLLVVALLLGAAGAEAEPGPEHDYVLHCAGCHKFDGTGSERVPALDEVGLVLAAAGGRDYLARVPGVAQAPLSDDRLAALLNWMLAELGKVQPQPPFNGAEVGRLRSSPLRDPIAARRAILGDDASRAMAD